MHKARVYINTCMVCTQYIVTRQSAVDPVNWRPQPPPPPSRSPADLTGHRRRPGHCRLCGHLLRRRGRLPVLPRLRRGRPPWHGRQHHAGDGSGRDFRHHRLQREGRLRLRRAQLLRQAVQWSGGGDYSEHHVLHRVSSAREVFVWGEGRAIRATCSFICGLGTTDHSRMFPRMFWGKKSPSEERGINQ